MYYIDVSILQVKYLNNKTKCVLLSFVFMYILKRNKKKSNCIYTLNHLQIGLPNSENFGIS